MTESTTHPAQPSGNGMATIAGYFFAVRMVTGLIAVRVFALEPREGSAIQLGLNFLLLLLVCFHSLGTASRSFGSLTTLPGIRWVVAFLAFSGLSLTWSSTTILPAAVLYWLALAADVLIVLLLLRAGPTDAVVDGVLKGFTLGACSTSLIAWLMPASSDLRLGDIEFFNANQIGFLAAFGALLAFYLLRARGQSWTLAIAFLTLTLVRSLSKTTIVAFLVSGTYLLLADKALSRRTKLLISGAVLLVLPIFWGLFAAYYAVYSNAGNQAETLTGRTAIWAYVLNEAVKQPWLGHGFDSMWKVIPPLGDFFEPRHAENEILQQFYSFGIVGILLLAGLYGTLLNRSRKLPAGPPRLFLMAMLWLIVVRGLAEAEPFDLLLPLWAITLFSVLIAGETDGSAAVTDLTSLTTETLALHTGVPV